MFTGILSSAWGVCFGVSVCHAWSSCTGGCHVSRGALPAISHVSDNVKVLHMFRMELPNSLQIIHCPHRVLIGHYQWEMHKLSLHSGEVLTVEQSFLALGMCQNLAKECVLNQNQPYKWRNRDCLVKQGTKSIMHRFKCYHPYHTVDTKWYDHTGPSIMQNRPQQRAGYW